MDDARHGSGTTGISMDGGIAGMGGHERLYDGMEWRLVCI